MNDKLLPKPEKFDTVNKLLDDEYVMAHINTGAEHLVIPQHLKKTPSVTLKLSRLFRGGIEIAPDKIQANLLFGAEYFACTIPLHALWAVTDQKGQTTIWAEDTPTELLEGANSREIQEPAKEAQNTKARPMLRRVK